MTSRALTAVPPLAGKISPTATIRRLSRDDPTVRRLFRPFIHADFQPDGPNPPRITQDEHKWLRTHALQFGLDPDRDLNIPPLHSNTNRSTNTSTMLKNSPIDQRLAAELARFEKLRMDKEERVRARTEKQITRQLAEGKITLDDIEEPEAHTKAYLPLRLRPAVDQEKYRDEKLQSIQMRMSTMDEVVTAWKAKRRDQRRQRREAARKL